MATIDTTTGPLRVEHRDGLTHARGVPYATAERFRPPRPAPRSATVRDATVRGPACPQDPSRLDNVNGPIIDQLEQREDCLVLSVTAPIEAAGLPVMVWFHGGAYLSGGGEAPKYDPDDLAREGVVVVNVTYRLGVLGYLTPAGAGADNLGLLDQIAALFWVRDNIAAFGGDPETVTVFGQSAGGDSVLALIAAPSAKGLFHRAIVQSAPTGARSDRTAMTQAMRAALTGHLDSDPLTASTDQILAAQRHAIAVAQKFGVVSGLPFGPIYGLDPLPITLHQALAEAAPRVELLIGYTRDDAAPFVAMDPRAGAFAELGPLGRRIERFVARRITAKVFGDATTELARNWNDVGGDVATFRFDWQPPDAPFGACHCLELPLLFNGDWSDAPMLAGHPVPTSLAAEVRRTWADFARRGTEALPTRTLRFH
ncbi:carboxylesterase family protein [Nocardia fluminea]|uniref:carboxylesterase family protein n=1 Tax=Nocardia fluminea TaxID=134984 RepID=UPI003D1470A1